MFNACYFSFSSDCCIVYCLVPQKQYYNAVSYIAGVTCDVTFRIKSPIKSPQREGEGHS